jgi:hypothetical protein
MVVHIFNCPNNSQRYGFTQNKEGINLPTESCIDGWTFWRTITLTRGVPTLGIEVDSVIDMINNDGFAIQEATVNFLKGEG